MKAWKSTEKEVAEILHGERIVRSNYGESQPDVITDDFVIECKSRKQFPVLIEKAFQQALSYAKRFNKMPLVVIHKKNAKGYGKYLVVIEINDFRRLYENCNHRE